MAMPDNRLTNAPYVTAKSSRILGKIRVRPEDFWVEEVPAYAPCGEGEHLFVHLEKVGLNTQEAVQMLARALKIDPAGASWAGLKDRQAVTTQWVSLHGADPNATAAIDLPGIRVLEARRHTHKLKNGHLRGNRFRIRIRGPEGDLALARQLMEELATTGCPNYYGDQRFGRDGQNAERALAWMRGEARPPRGRFQRKLLFSSLQSAMFNVWLAERIKDGQLGTALQGDILRKEETGGLFCCDDPAIDSARAARFEVSATGPMFGHRMRAAEGPAGDREQGIQARFGVQDADLGNFRRLGDGTRRVARIRPMDWSIEAEGSDLLIFFRLPKGAYATVVLREVMKQPSDGHSGPV